MATNEYTISKIQLPSGDVCNIKDTTYSAGTGIGISGTTISNTGVTGIKGNSESSYRTGQVNLTAANIGAVASSGNETVTGNKTFSGITNLTIGSTYSVTNGTVIPANASAIIQSPIPKYLWHDIWAFCRATTPKYYTSTNGSSWIESTLEKRLFSHKEAWGKSNVLSSSIKGSRWVWLNGGFYASAASWLVLGVTYNYPSAHFNLTLETSDDGGSNWTILMTATDLYYSQTPIWIRSIGTCQDSLRLTLTWNNNSESNAALGLCSIRFLTSRWGDQGKGGEYEYPYTWDINYNISPLSEAKFIGPLEGNVTGNVSGTATNVTGTVAIDHGGTGAATAAGARTNLGLGSMATEAATDYLKLSGGTMTGPLKWTSSSALPEKAAPEYFLTIDTFASGGTTYWVSKANAKKALLDTNTTHNNQFLRKDGTWTTPPYPVTSVAGNTGAITADTLRTSLGLSNAMHFLGVTTTNISTGTANTTATVSISGSNVTAAAGDVVLYGSQEYVWGNSKWNLLGDESSYALKSTTLSGYGITDAKITNGVITLGNNSITPLTSSNDIVIEKTSPLFTLHNENITRGIAPSANTYTSIQFKSKKSDNKILGVINNLYQSDGIMRMEFLTATPLTTNDAVYHGIRLFHTSENVSRVDFDVSKLSTTGVWDTDITINKGTETQANSFFRVSAGGREMWFYANNVNGNLARGIWLPATGTGTGKSVVSIDDNNNIYYNSGKVNGDLWIQPTSAATATYLGIRNTAGALYFWQSSSSTNEPNKGIYIASAGDTNTIDDSPLFEVNQANRIRRWADYNIGIQYSTNFYYASLDVTKNAHARGGTAGTVVYPSNWSLTDTNGNIVTRLEANIYSATGNTKSEDDGRVDAYWYVRNNYNGSSFDALGIRMTIYASGTKAYQIQNPELFKAALFESTPAMNPLIKHFNGIDQHWGIGSVVQAATSGTKAYLNKRTFMVLTDVGMGLWNSTDEKWGWSFQSNGNDLIYRLYQNPAESSPGTLKVNAKLAFKTNDSNPVGSASTPIFLDGNGKATACSYTFTNYLLKSGGTMTGELTVNAAASFISTSTSTARYIYFKNTALVTTSPNIVMQIGLSSNNQYHGIYSQGYYDGTSFTPTGGWLIGRNAEGKATIGGSTSSPMGVELIGNTSVINGYFFVGADSDTVSRSVYATSNSGRICLYSTGNSNGNGNRGVWIAKQGSNGQEHAIVSADANNQSRINLMRSNDSFINLYRYDVTRGTAPSAAKYWTIGCYENYSSDTKRLALIDAHYNTDGSISVEMMTQTPVSTNENDAYRGIMITQNPDKSSITNLRTDEITASGHLYPVTNSATTLGTDTNAWKQIFIQNTSGSNGDITIKRGSSVFKIGYGSDDTNYGLYDAATSQWMIYSDGTKTILSAITTGAINATGSIAATSNVWAGTTTASGDHEVYAASTIGRIGMYSDGSKDRGIWIYKDAPGKPNSAFAALKYNNNDNTMTIKCNRILAIESDDGFFGYGTTVNGWNGVTDNSSQIFGSAAYKTYIRSNNNPLYHRRNTTTYMIPDGRNNYATNTRIWGITLPTNSNNTTNKNNTIELVVDNNCLFLWDNTNAKTLWQIPPIVYSTTTPSSPTEGMIWLQPIS